uniref:Uncharacterized protein n=1 Tax=Anguilla anguilla TaxID=7936 RepID=A0A0E9TJL0_ANGAN
MSSNRADRAITSDRLSMRRQ